MNISSLLKKSYGVNSHSSGTQLDRRRNPRKALALFTDFKAPLLLSLLVSMQNSSYTYAIGYQMIC